MRPQFFSAPRVARGILFFFHTPKPMKKHILTAAVAAALVLPAFAQNVAVVNGQPVPKARLEALEAQIKEQAERMGHPAPKLDAEKLREELIVREIYMQEVKRKGLEGSEPVRRQLEMMREQVLITALLEDYKKNNPVSDKEAKAEYDRLVEKEKPEAGAKEYKASHILVEKEDEAKDIIAKLKKGGKFDEIAKKQSKDPGSGARGGDLGWASPKSYVPEFSEAMQKLKKGDMTEAPVKSQFGWHIIRLDDVRDAKAPQLPPFDKVKPQIVRHLEEQKLLAWQQELRKNAKVE